MDAPSGQPAIRLAIFFYAGLTAVAFLWGAWQGDLQLFYWSELLTLPRLLASLAGGVTIGLLTVLLSRLLLRRSLRARELYGWFYEILGPLSWPRALLLGLVSALGEELLFRGAMLRGWGLFPSSLIFALLHLPPNARWWFWPALSGCLGLLFGWLTLSTGTLAGAIVAHFLINSLNLRHLVRHAPPASGEDGEDKDTPRP